MEEEDIQNRLKIETGFSAHAPLAPMILLCLIVRVLHWHRGCLLFGFCVCMAKICAIMYIFCGVVHKMLFISYNLCIYAHTAIALHSESKIISVRCLLNVTSSALVDCRRGGIIPIIFSVWAKSACVADARNDNRKGWTMSRERNEPIFKGFPYDLFALCFHWLCVVSLNAFDSFFYSPLLHMLKLHILYSFVLFVLYLFSLSNHFSSSFVTLCRFAVVSVCKRVRLWVCVCVPANMLTVANRAL